MKVSATLAVSPSGQAGVGLPSGLPQTRVLNQPEQLRARRDSGESAAFNALLSDFLGE